MWVTVRGGLGNQMFQTAYAIALAAKFDVKPVFIDLSDMARVPRRWELACFGIAPNLASDARRLQLAAIAWTTRRMQRLGLPGFPGALVERAEFSGPPALHRAPRLVTGYWQGPAYFNGYEDQVRQVFRFPELPADDQLRHDAGRPVAAIHVRRGDYVNDPVARSIHLVCDASWYRSAWQKLRQTVNNCQALVFSDDPEWAHEHLVLDGDVEYVAGDPCRPAWVDLARMSQCQHFVISNSSYSWWAAFLSVSSGKQVIAPRYWFQGVEAAKLQICPQSWILL